MASWTAKPYRPADWRLHRSGDRDQRRADVREQSEPLLFAPVIPGIHDAWAHASAGEQDVRRMKDHRASWRHSADTATNERLSKVIDRRIRDARRAEKRRKRRARKLRISQPCLCPLRV